MFTSERHQDIINCLQLEGRVKVKTLSERYDVSEDCIRKDLKLLEQKGYCERVYGGAVVKEQETYRNVFQRQNLDIEDKKELAKKIYDCIQDGETIYLDVSTTNLIVADLLANGDKRCIIVSNMLDILQILAKNPSLTVIGTGGNVNLELSGFIGAATIQLISRHNFDRCFIGTTGIDIKNKKITTFDLDDGLVKEQVLKNSKKRYLIMENHKFEMVGTYKFANIDVIDYVITNDSLSNNGKNMLHKLHVSYI